jgi:hypothetical protein
VRRGPSRALSLGDYDGAVSTVTLIAWIVFGVSIVGGLLVAGLKGFDAWRAFRRFKRTTEAAMLRVSASITQMEIRTAGVNERVARLERAQANLQETLRTARVLAGAAGEVYASYRRVRKYMPGK